MWHKDLVTYKFDEDQTSPTHKPVSLPNRCTKLKPGQTIICVHISKIKLNIRN